MLPISFDNLAHMEVDFLCEEARVVIELDGAQHLTHTAAVAARMRCFSSTDI